MTQNERARAFRALHERDGAFIIPNPWDAGTALLLAQLGFEALATTSAGFAFSMGRRDTAVGRDAMIAHVGTIAAATDLPVSADLENGFSDDPEVAAETIRLAAAAGVVGGSIEDATGRADGPIYCFEHAVARVEAAAEAAHSLPFPFTFTARCENFLNGRPDLKDTIARLQAYQEAGADVLYAPGVTIIDDLATLIKSVDRPVNVLIGEPGLTFASLSKIGAKRMSVGSSLARASLTAFILAAREMRNEGTFNFAAEAIPYGELNEMFQP